jgi:hypothetical protein
MSRLLPRLVLLALGLGALLAGVLLFRGAEATVGPARPGALAPEPPRGGTDPLAPFRRLATSGSPFRTSRQLPRVRFGDASLLPPAPTAPPSPRPRPVLTGILWGQEPAAILEGMPGVEGAVVLRRGEVAGGLRLVKIAPDGAELRDADTSWTLSVRQPWP